MIKWGKKPINMTGHTRHVLHVHSYVHKLKLFRSIFLWNMPLGCFFLFIAHHCNEVQIIACRYFWNVDFLLGLFSMYSISLFVHSSPINFVAKRLILSLPLTLLSCSRSLALAVIRSLSQPGKLCVLKLYQLNVAVARICNQKQRVYYIHIRHLKPLINIKCCWFTSRLSMISPLLNPNYGLLVCKQSTI